MTKGFKKEKMIFNFGNMMESSIGAAHGISHGDIEAVVPAINDAFCAIDEKKNAKKLGFAKLPYESAHAAGIQLEAEKIAKSFDDFIVVGIGGSALGNIALHAACNHPYYNLLSRKDRGNRPRVFVTDNIDPDRLNGLLDVVDLPKTFFNVITKSGDTAETMATYFVFRDRLQKAMKGKKIAQNIAATTSLTKGNLLKIARAEGYKIFDIPEDVGGRFSVLTSVGLLSLAVSGIDIEELLAGARAMDEFCAGSDIWENPALLSAALQYIYYRKGKRISVMMPYSSALKELADWYAQLWAESLGKRVDKQGRVVNVGPTPVKTLGATDQHSQLQLYAEGPNDKVITFLSVMRHQEAMTIPSCFKGMDVSYLCGHTIGELLHVEQRATELALRKSERPSCRITLPEVRPYYLGALIYFYELQTAYAGELFNINAFDQPGVEEGKRFAYGVMGRAGYEEKKKEYASAQMSEKRYVIHFS
jgi:glucose-6-phosphate isomerase